MRFRKDKDSTIDDVSIISEGMEIQGNINTVGSIRLDGKVYGDVKSGGNITIGETGEIHGNIQAKSITNGGLLIGSAIIDEKITLESKSKLKGDIAGRILVIEEGAVFIGTSSMLINDAVKNETSGE